MTFWKLGCNWGSGQPDFYKMLRKESIVITGKYASMQKGDVVAICQGYNVVALAKIIQDPYPSTSNSQLENEFGKYNIDFADWNRVCPSVIYELPKADVFQYQLQQGICCIQSKQILSNIKKHLSSLISLESNMPTQEIADLLSKQKNIILTGAPGTGKTYLAKEIAKSLGCSEENIGFVQFHPSYDYTDFVEGLRPVQKGDTLGFERKDGVFKEFCKKAMEQSHCQSNFEDVYQQFIDYLEENSLELETPKLKKKFIVVKNTRNNLTVTPRTEVATSMTVTKEMLKEYLENGKIIDWKPYTTPLGDYIKKEFRFQKEDIFNNLEQKYVFIIDEINRGEISKIFGELFYSIDLGYRGEEGKVKTQYQNLITDTNDPFYNGFYIPENVYVIGTMNDIDRSVESMDFAFRRRFAFIEIKASENIGMLNTLNDANLKNEVIKKMNAINKNIENISGLSSAYHIGASYFLKLKDYQGSEKDRFTLLWQNHLECLIKEYLRGNPNSVDELNKIREAYNK